MQAKGQVVVGADPVRRINGTGLHGGEHLGTGQLHRRGTHLAQHLSGEARHTHLQTLQVLHAVDFLVEPTRHLGAGVATGKRLEIELSVEIVPQFLTATMVQPAIHFLGRKPEGDGGKERRGRVLAFPVVGGPMTHLGAALAHRIEHFKGRHQFLGAIDLDLDTPGRHLFHPLGKAVGASPQAGIVLRPSGDHFPFVGLLFGLFLFRLRAGGSLTVHGRAIFLFAAGQRQATQPQTQGGNKFTTIQGSSSDKGRQHTAAFGLFFSPNA